jgi:hypothetical protein
MFCASKRLWRWIVPWAGLSLSVVSSIRILCTPCLKWTSFLRHFRPILTLVPCSRKQVVKLERLTYFFFFSGRKMYPRPFIGTYVVCWRQHTLNPTSQAIYWWAAECLSAVLPHLTFPELVTFLLQSHPYWHQDTQLSHIDSLTGFPSIDQLLH